MSRAPVFGAVSPRRSVIRVLGLLLGVALFAATCSGGDAPSLTADRPPTPTDPAPESPAAPDDAAAPTSQTTEFRIPATVPGEEGSDPNVPPPLLPDVPLPEEMANPDLTVLPPEELPPPPPPLPPPTSAPAWEPVTVLISNEDVNGVIPVYDAPDGTRLAFPDGELWSYTFRGNRLVARVTQGSQGDEWVQADLPVRPNGVRGWIRTENFNWSTVTSHILIDVSDRSVALFEGDSLVASTRAIVGKPATPTPTLSGFLVEKLPNHDQQNASVVLGSWILMLSFFSESLSSFGGGLPRIALHGTHIPERVGEALSNGCIRIPNDIIETIAQRAPLGTVVNIVA